MSDNFRIGTLVAFLVFATMSTSLFGIQNPMPVLEQQPSSQSSDNPMPDLGSSDAVDLDQFGGVLFTRAANVPSSSSTSYSRSDATSYSDCPGGVCPDVMSPSVPNSPTIGSVMGIPRQSVVTDCGCVGSMVATGTTSSHSQSFSYGSCTGSVMVAPSYGSQGSAMYGQSPYGSYGGSYASGYGSSGSGYGYTGRSRRWWFGKRLGWSSPGERRARRNPNFGARVGIQYTTSVPASGYTSTVASYGSTDWTWPGGTEASLRQHLSGPPHFYEGAYTDSFASLISRHNNDHNGIGYGDRQYPVVYMTMP